MIREEKERYFDRVEEKINELPWFVSEFIYKNRRNLSPKTLLNYCHDYIIFFDWIISNDIFHGDKVDIPLHTLETLTTQQVEDFLLFLQFRLHNTSPTVNRKISSLKSLFNYLQNKAETKELKPYLNRNVMAKIDLNSVNEDIETTATRIDGKILKNDEFDAFRQYVAYDYGISIIKNTKLYKFHIFNRERDTAIISLILGSGLRLSEVTGINIDDIDFSKSSVRVIRKGNKEQYVYFSEIALNDIKEYLSIREERYKLPKSNKALFISAPIGPRGTSRRLTSRAIEKLVEKYASAFGKPALSVHKLRHSFATRYHKENNDIPKLKKQLGHSSIQTTMIYTHLGNNELKEAVDNMDKERSN